MSIHMYLQHIFNIKHKISKCLHVYRKMHISFFILFHLCLLSCYNTINPHPFQKSLKNSLFIHETIMKKIRKLTQGYKAANYYNYSSIFLYLINGTIKAKQE